MMELIAGNLRRGYTAALFAVLFFSAFFSSSHAMPPVDADASRIARGNGRLEKRKDQPNPLEAFWFREKERIQERLNSRKLDSAVQQRLQAVLSALTKSGTDRVLAILAEFGGPDGITWKPGDHWDPIGKADSNESTGTAGDCSRIVRGAKTYEYSGPLHNEIPRPESASDRSGDTIWTEDFSPRWFHGFLFGNGVIFDYKRRDGSQMHGDFTGKSVRDYFEDMSGGRYSISGDIIPWVKVPHSSFWYGADACPGTRSSKGESTETDGQYPGGGDARSFVRDVLDAVRARHPDFNWQKYDSDGDGLIDRLWIIHAGYGEEDSGVLLNRTAYGEGSLWSHSWALQEPYVLDAAKGIKAQSYILMPENGGIGVFVHEAGHNLGAMDLYAYQGGETSPGYWTAMADNWTGHPIGFQPPALDPYHLDAWGWLNPPIISDPSGVYTLTLGQASRFPGGDGVVRAARIDLPNQSVALPARPDGHFYWWGGSSPSIISSMTLKTPLAIPARDAVLRARIAYDIEPFFDTFRVQVSDNGGASWMTLDSLNGANFNFPGLQNYSYSLASFEGKSILVRFEYDTDSTVQGNGAFVDSVSITGTRVAFHDDAEIDSGAWRFAGSWERTGGSREYAHSYYLQWRNTGPDGGYDSALGEGYKYGPAEPGLLIWYNNNLYDDNEISLHLDDAPSFGPKGKMLLVDSHPEPLRDPSRGFRSELTNLPQKLLVRDAPFSLISTRAFSYAGMSFGELPAADTFDDAKGMYPGIEYTPGGSDGSEMWMTKAWDSSVVLPSTLPYTLREAPGDVHYDSSYALRYQCVPSTAIGGQANVSCRYFAGGIKNPGGGSGNPGDVLGQYGWHVKILRQDTKSATVRVWNSNGQTGAGDQVFLSVINSGNGKGIVTSEDQSLSCSSVCSKYYPKGTPVTLSASPAEGSRFIGWSGSACRGTAPCTVVLESDNSVRAEFQTDACYTLTAVPDPPEGGDVAVLTPPNCGVSNYASGTHVQLAYTAASGHEFAGWQGAASDGVVVMDNDEFVSGLFTLKCFSISVETTSGGTASILTAPNCGGGMYRFGTAVRVAATPEAGYSFSGWDGASARGIVVADGDKRVTALFSPKKCVKLSVAAKPSKVAAFTYSPRPNCNRGRGFLVGTTVRVTAKPKKGYTVERWEGLAGIRTVKKKASVSVPLTAPITLRVTLKKASKSRN